MIWLLALGIFAAVGAGVYLATSRDVLQSVVGVSIVAAAANLVVFVSGGVGGAPPVIAEGLERLEPAAAAPLPQALVLTAIVIGFSLTCFSLVVVLGLKQRTGSSDAHDLRAAEPPPDASGAPAFDHDAVTATPDAAASDAATSDAAAPDAAAPVGDRDEPSAGGGGAAR